MNFTKILGRPLEEHMVCMWIFKNVVGTVASHPMSLNGPCVGGYVGIIVHGL